MGHMSKKDNSPNNVNPVVHPENSSFANLSKGIEK
jgi:hypothetical protein